MYKKLVEGKKAVFFDLDGTIVNTQGIWTESVQSVLEKLGIDWVSDKNAFTPGVDLNLQWKNLIRKYSIKTDKTPQNLTEETHDEYLRLLNEGPLEPKEGFWDFLYEIKEEKGLKAALITNSKKDVAYETLKKINAENSFDLVIYGDEVKDLKPNPEIYLLALQKMSLKPEEVLVFEDSLAGVSAADSAGISIVAIENENFVEEEFKGKKVYIILPDFSPLPKHLDRTFKEWVEYHAQKADEKQRKIEQTKASDVKV